MTRDDILRKIQNLLDLATSDNEHEAALAASKAQDLMLKYDLTSMDVEGRQEPSRIGEDGAYRYTKVSLWKSSLFGTVAKTSNCVAYIKKEPNGYKANGTRKTIQVLVLVGAENDVAVAKYVFDYLVRELDRLAKEYSASVETFGQRGLLKHKRESWYKGAVVAVQATLQAEYLKRTMGADANALVVVKDGAVKAYVAKEVGPLSRVYRQRRAVDYNAYAQGQRDGSTIGVNPGVGGQQASRPELEA